MRLHEILSEAFEVNHRLIGYHATQPRNQNLVLKNREVRGMDSMGTWLSSSREMVTWAYGKTVEAYELPRGQYLQGRQNQREEILLTCIPIIEKVFGDDVADHMLQYPLTPENRRFLVSMRRQEREGRERDADYDHHWKLKWESPNQLTRWQELEQTLRYQTQIARSTEYCQHFRDFMARNYQGIAWVGVKGWDHWPKAVNIYLIFDHDDLHPIREPEKEMATTGGFEPLDVLPPV